MFHSTSDNNHNKALLAKFGVFSGTNDPGMEKLYDEFASRYMNHRVTWRATNDNLKPLSFQQADQLWELRVNNFPDEPAYTLLINGRAIISFDNFPSHAWKLPDSIEQDIYLKLAKLQMK